MSSLRFAPRVWIPLASGAVAAAAIGVGLVTIGPLAPDGGPATTTSVDTHPSAQATTSPTEPEPTTSGPARVEIEFAFAREATVDDATALARMANPRTGETWHEPRLYAGTADGFEPIPGDYTYSIPGTTLLVDVGDRAGTDIVLEISTGDVRGESPAGMSASMVVAVFEVHNGFAYRISCPAELDKCYDDSPYWKYSNHDIFYDSLGLPSHIEFGNGLVIEPYGGHFSNALAVVQAVAPDWYTTVYAPPRVKLTDLGAGALYRVDLESEIPGLTDSYFEYTIATGEARPVWAWDTGIDGWVLDGTDGWPGERATVGFCEELGGASYYTREANHVVSDWVPKGASFSPIGGGNPIAKAVHDEMKGRGGDAYVFASYEDFLAADSVRAVPAPDGEWMVFVHQDAYVERPEDAESRCD